MKCKLIICDICRTEGVVRLAKIAYLGEERTIYHACATHAKSIRGYGLEIVEEFELPGDAPESVAYE